jgi:Domain of unknown function (DUF4214)
MAVAKRRMPAYDHFFCGFTPDERSFTLQAIRHINQLLALNDLQLVEALYASLLHRQAAPDELEFYIGQLRGGYGKAEMIADFGALPEADGGAATIAGLQEHVAKQSTLRNSLWRPAERDRKRERQLNRVENSLGQVVHELAALKLEARLRLEAVEKRLRLFRGDEAEVYDRSGPHREPEANTTEGVDMSSESATVRRIFRELVKQADSANSQEPE